MDDNSKGKKTPVSLNLRSTIINPLPVNNRKRPGSPKDKTPIIIDGKEVSRSHIGKLAKSPINTGCL